MADTVLDFIRHGEPAGTSTYRGNGVDDPLSEKGWSQMWGAVGDRCPWTLIVSSPLIRCRDFAEKLAKKHAIPVKVENRLKEVGFGSWEGRERSEIRQTNPEEYEAFYRDPVNCRPEGAEDLMEFFNRVKGAIENIRDEFTGQHILLVGHAGVIRGAMMLVTQQSAKEAYAAKVVNATFTRIRFTENGGLLEFKNKVSL